MGEIYGDATGTCHLHSHSTAGAQDDLIPDPFVKRSDGRVCRDETGTDRHENACRNTPGQVVAGLAD